MELSFTHQSSAPVAQIFDELVDLSKYSQWMPLVRSAELVSGSEIAKVWSVTLTGSIGKLRRSKRLRMELVEAEPFKTIAFERREIDGRDHSLWLLKVDLEPSESGTSVRVSLRYDGGLWEPVVERMLRGEIDESKRRLEDQLDGLVEGS